MSIFNVREAKTHLSRLLERAAQGEEVVIAKRGRPVAKLVPVKAEPRRPGRLKGRIRIGADFDDPLRDEILGAFRGGRSLESEEKLWSHQPEMQARILRAEEDLASGRSTRTETPEQAQAFLDSLKRKPPLRR
jgi:prevent-host-death family protein